MKNIPSFPTRLHQDTAERVRDYFLNIPYVDTVLVVNSCARGQAVPESDLDLAVLVKPGTTSDQIKSIETSWLKYSSTQETIQKYKKSNQFAHLHLDLIDGNYFPLSIDPGEPIDFFEVEIGNHICYSAPMDQAGLYFQELQRKWLPYYGEELRMQRLEMARNACEYNLNHIPFFVKRELYFQAFETLWQAFKEYLQTLFIAHKTYPIAYNKWIKYQVISLLNKPQLYPKLSPILSITNIESREIINKAKMLHSLLTDLPIE